MIVRNPSDGTERPVGHACVGDVAVCPNGHVIADVVRNLSSGDMSYSSAFKFRGKHVEPGTLRKDCTCPECGAIWFEPDEEA